MAVITPYSKRTANRRVTFDKDEIKKVKIETSTTRKKQRKKRVKPQSEEAKI